jgi:hypothetical protein
LNVAAQDKFLAKSTALFLAGTVTLGLLLRWEFVTGFLTELGFSFAHVRHSHSHAGYYGVLVLPSLWALRRRGLIVPQPLLLGYVGSAALASLLFAFMGYAWPTITLSTFILGVWIFIAVRWWRNCGISQNSWFDVVPWGVVCGGLVVPAIAVSASRNPELSLQLAHFFLALLLLGGFVPAAFGLFGVRRRIPLAGVIAAVVGGAAALAFRLLDLYMLPLLLFLAWVYITAVVGSKVPALLKLDWLLLVLFLPGAAFDLGDANNLRIAGIHYTVLGPVALTFLYAALPESAYPGNGWLTLYHATLGAMLLAIVAAPALIPGMAAMAVAGVSTLYVLVVLGSIVWFFRR